MVEVEKGREFFRQVVGSRCAEKELNLADNRLAAGPSVSPKARRGVLEQQSSFSV